MAPNSEEDFQCKRGWEVEYIDKELLRPPVYNPEDYASYLKKWGKKTTSGMQIPLYLSQSTGSIERISADFNISGKKQSSPCTKSSLSVKNNDDKTANEKNFSLKLEKKDSKNKEYSHKGSKSDLNIEFKNPILALSNQDGEMSLRQFSSVTELLEKLKLDLKLSFPSFVQEFVGDPVDGVTLLLELLRSIQLSQANQQQKRPPQIFRRALLDEYSCLVCLKYCLRCSDANRRLASSSAGLFTLAVCIMSNVTQSRIIALELLTKACEVPIAGHKAVSEALSTLRLRFGEPVRFRFLVGMLNSAGTIELLAVAVKFINAFVETALSIQQKVYIQAELEQAGFDSKTLRKTLPCNSESVKMELTKWDKSYFDVENLQSKVLEVNSLYEKIQLLEKRIEILQEEKGILKSLEQCLKERCSELEEEMSIKTSTTTKTPSTKPFKNYNLQQNKRSAEKGESTPAEDEGISSSEQELSQDEDYVKQRKNSCDDSNKSLKCIKEFNKPSLNCQDPSSNGGNKNFKNIRNNNMKESNVDDGNEIIKLERQSICEDETTIDEVIEELENIVNDAKTGVYKAEKGLKFDEELLRIKSKENNNTFAENNNRTHAQSYDKNVFEEMEIIPTFLHPQPPRKAKSLVHIYFPSRDFDSHEDIKNEFFDEDTDTESSDSLLTATREKNSTNRSYNKSSNVTDSFGSSSSTNTRTLFIKHENDYENQVINTKSECNERNMDEEDNKKGRFKHSKNFSLSETRRENFSSRFFSKDNKFMGDFRKTFQKDINSDRFSNKSNEIIESSRCNNLNEKQPFQGINDWTGSKMINDNVIVRPAPKFAPTPVKRSQTFHISTSNSETFFKRTALKPKMGVSGLDFQRNNELKAKSGKLQGADSKIINERNAEFKNEYSARLLNNALTNYKINNDLKNDVNLFRRGSFNELFSTVEMKPECSTQCNEPDQAAQNIHNNNSSDTERPNIKVRSKSLEKMDEGLDSLVDIVYDETKKSKLKSEINIELSKNIGPRTRRSLAESSLFSQPGERVTEKAEESLKPPKPAQRTSLARHNSSISPVHLVRERKLLFNSQQQFKSNSGLKPANSENSVYSAFKRCPPDGSSSPKEFSLKSIEKHNSSFDEKTPIYSIPVKPIKHHKFFENGTSGNAKSNQTSNSNTQSGSTKVHENPVSPMPRSIQNLSNTQENKNECQNISQRKYKPVISKTNATSKPNFLLGTYQSQVTKSIPKPSSSVLNSINAFNNTFLVRKSSGNIKMYTSTRTGLEYNNLSQTRQNSENATGRQLSTGNATKAEKLTDFPSGLY